MRLAIVNATGDVENIIEAPEDFDPGGSTRVVPADGGVGLGWRWDGRTFVMPAVQPPPPDSVTDLQFRLALNALGLREAAEAIVQQGSQGLRDYWERALEIHRRHPFVAEAAKALQKSDTEIDALFALASTM